MCGIIGITGKNAGGVTDEKVGAMLSCLSRRGPDDKGFARFPEAILGQTRLSIVDLVTGHQPMRDNARPHTLVFNGEIYDYKAVRNSLEKAGHRFSTASDSEVILKAYAEYGRECVKRLDGMFAFAIWDEEKEELMVARDRFGKKPLYYAEHDGMLVFASEIKSLLALGVKGEIDPAALDDYLRLMYIPPQKTVYSNIHAVLPAHAAVARAGKLETWRYWSLEKKGLSVSYEEAKKNIQNLFDEAVRKRMVADVEVGSLLSGGVDSTLVTYYAQKYSSFPIKTFSVGYEGARSELPYALEASRKIGTDHRTLDVRASLPDELSAIIEYMDEPHGDSSDFPQHMISGLASRSVKVALTGDGADELFMGYGWYQKHLHTPRWKLSRWLGDAWSEQQKEVTVFGEKEREALLKPRFAKDRTFEKLAVAGIADPIHKINAYDLSVYLPGQLLSKIDRTSMMHSLEIRSPFLDTKLAEYVYSLPTEFKLSKTGNKIILKDILSDIFPKDFVYRRKQGFGAPVDGWLAEPGMRSLVEKLFVDSNPAFAYLDRAAAVAVKDDFYSRKDRRSAQKLWVLACLLLWFEKHHA